MTLDLDICLYYINSMPRIQFISESEIKLLMTQEGAIARIRAGQFTRDEIDRSPAKSVPGGISVMYNYYDESGVYVATAHKLITTGDEPVHCDAKRFVAGNNDYRIPISK